MCGLPTFRPDLRVRLTGYDRSFVCTQCSGGSMYGLPGIQTGYLCALARLRSEFRVHAVHRGSMCGLPDIQTGFSCALARLRPEFRVRAVLRGSMCGLPGIQTGYLCALAPLRPEFRVHAVHQGRKSPGFLADRIFVCACPAGTGFSCTTPNQRAQFDRFQPGSDRNFVCVGSCHRSFVYDRRIRR